MTQSLLFILTFLFFATWALAWLPPIRLHLIERFPQMRGCMCFLCFHFLNFSKSDLEHVPFYKKIATHEYRHQWQQRLLSPALFALLYFGEWGFRILFLKQSIGGAYQNLFWEKDANQNAGI